MNAALYFLQRMIWIGYKPYTSCTRQTHGLFSRSSAT